MLSGLQYYITLEGIDENGDLNVYYAELLHDTFGEEMGWELIKFVLVDESFSYPFEEKWLVFILVALEQSSLFFSLTISLPLVNGHLIV